MLRLLIKDITVDKLPPKQLLAHVRWQGGACTDLSVQLPPNIADRKRHPSAIVDQVRELALSLPNAQIAEQLNREGHVSTTGKPYTAKVIQWLRWRYQIPTATLKRPEDLTVQQVAKHFGVSAGVVYYWIQRRLLQARRLNRGMPYWITLNPSDEHNLRERVRNSRKIEIAQSIPKPT